VFEEDAVLYTLNTNQFFGSSELRQLELAVKLVSKFTVENRRGCGLYPMGIVAIPSDSMSGSLG